MEELLETMKTACSRIFSMKKVSGLPVTIAELFEIRARKEVGIRTNEESLQSEWVRLADDQAMELL